VGSVFSPYYHWARRHTPVDPTRFCAINVALYGQRGQRWAMTERGARHLHREADSFAVAASSLAWHADGLTITIDEMAVPVPRPVRGRVHLSFEAMTPQSFAIDAAGRHIWWPIAPAARVSVAFERPGLSWSGHGYLDHNSGDEPLESGFRKWDWSRARLGDGAVVLYDVTRADGSTAALAYRFDRTGTAHPVALPPATDLPRTGWRVPRRTRTDPGSRAQVVRTLEDAPFYARSLVEARLLGEPVRAVHESLSLERFCQPWVRALLPFRMPRRP